MSAKATEKPLSYATARSSREPREPYECCCCRYGDGRDLLSRVVAARAIRLDRLFSRRLDWGWALLSGERAGRSAVVVAAVPIAVGRFLGSILYWYDKSLVRCR
jgi:hypothetical protein